MNISHIGGRLRSRRNAHEIEQGRARETYRLTGDDAVSLARATHRQLGRVLQHTEHLDGPALLTLATACRATLDALDDVEATSIR